MLYIDITVPKLGTDANAFEDVLLDAFEKFECQEVRVVERPLRARCGSSHTAWRYRVYTQLNFVKTANLLHDVLDRLRARTSGRITLTSPNACQTVER
jgi:hypothetical protein